MSRSQRFQRLAQIRRLSEDQAANRLASARDAITAREQAVAALCNHRDDFNQRQQGGRLTAGQWRQQREFVGALDQVIQQHTQQRGHDEAELARLEADWREAYGARRAMETLSDQWAVREQRVSDRAEQSANDDAGARLARS